MIEVNSPTDAVWLALWAVFNPLNILVSATIAVGTVWALWFFTRHRRKG